MKKEKPILEWKIKCSGHYHKMGISEKGKIIFYNHSKEEIRNETILTTLTDRKGENECYNFFQTYKDYIKGKIDISNITKGRKVLLSDYVSIQRKKSIDRRYTNQYNQKILNEENNFWLKLANRIRDNYSIENKIKNWCTSLLEDKTEKHVWITVKLDIVEKGEKTSPDFKITITYSKDYMYILITTAVTIKWLIAYEKNFAFIENYFVLDVLKKLGSEHYLVKAAKVDYDNLTYMAEVKIQEVEIKKEQDGKWHIVTKEKKKKKTSIILEASLKCSGHIHKIGITEKGDIVFFNHSKQEIKNESLLEKLSGVPSLCQCYNFIKEFKMVINSYKPSEKYFSKHTQVYKKILNSNYIEKIRWKKIKRKENSLTAPKDFKTYMAKKVYTEIYTSFHDFLRKAKEKIPYKTPDIGYIIGRVINIDAPNSIYYEKSDVVQPQINFSLSENDYAFYGIYRYIFTIYYSYKWHIIYKKFSDVLTDFFIISIKEKINPDSYIVSGLYINESGEPILSDATVKKSGNNWEIKLLQKDLSF